jgi:hypothetical protein
MPGSFRRRAAVSAFALLSWAVAPSAADAQGTILQINLKKAAEKLTSSLETRGTTVRVGVIPITSGDPALVTLAADTTTQFLHALDSEPNWPPRDVRLIETGSRPTALSAPSDHARGPINLDEAVRAGQRAAAAYVIVGSIVQTGTPLPERVELELIDIQSGRSVASTAAHYVSSERARDGQSFWTSKKFALIAGITATAFAVSQAWQANDELNVKKAELVAVPAGDLATFNRIHDQADTLSRTRNWWWGVAVGVASVTTSFVALTKSSPTIAPFQPATDPVSIPTGGRWSIGINPAAGRISLARSF